MGGVSLFLVRQVERVEVNPEITSLTSMDSNGHKVVDDHCDGRQWQLRLLAIVGQLRRRVTAAVTADDGRQRPAMTGNSRQPSETRIWIGLNWI